MNTVHHDQYTDIIFLDLWVTQFSCWKEGTSFLTKYFDNPV